MERTNTVTQRSPVMTFYHTTGKELDMENKVKIA